MPIDQAPQVTKIIRELLGDDYCYDETGTFRSIYRNFRECTFIEDDGDILFYRNRKGIPTRQMDGSVSPPLNDGKGSPEKEDIIL